MIKNMICITCPRGCHLSINDETLEVQGNSCPRGAVYAVNELTAPKRTVTTTVALQGAFLSRCPVKTSTAVDKKLMKDIVLALKKYTLHAPVKTGDVVVSDILGSHADVIVCRNFEKDSK